MYKKIFENIDGVSLLPTIALIIFFTAFVALLVWLWKMDRGLVSEMENLPLDTNQNSSKNLN